MPHTISIVTPAYNQGRFLPQTIESILSQKGNFCIDYIIINDGSTDNTKEVIEKYDTLLKRGEFPIACKGITFRFVNRENGGQASALNQGFGMATGHSAAWMNSDDYYYPDVFSEIAAAFERNPELDFVYGYCKIIDEEGRLVKSPPPPRPDETLESLKTRGNSFAMNFFSLDSFRRVGGIDESLRHCPDLDLWYRIFAIGKVGYVPVTIGAFRIWSGSITGSEGDKFAAERKMLAKRYGGNVISQHSLYALRKRFAAILDVIQKNMPDTYAALKKSFYGVVDTFQYRKKV